MVEKPIFAKPQKKPKKSKKTLGTRKQPDEIFNQSEQQYRNILNSIEDGYYEVDIAGNLTFFNDSLCKIYGYPRDELMGMNNREYMTPDTIKKTYEIFNRVYKTGESIKIFDWEFIKKDGSKIDVEISVSLIKNFQDRVTGFRGIIRDVGERKLIEMALQESHNELEKSVEERTKDLIKINKQLKQEIDERRHAEEALRGSQQIIEGIMHSVPVRVFWKDKDLVYLGCNAMFAHDAGFADPKDIIGKNDYQMGWCDQAEIYRNDDRQVIENGCSKFFIEEPQTTPEGKTITLLTSKVPLRDSKGRIIGILGTYLDITERKRAEKEILLAQKIADEQGKNALVGQIAGKMAHDFNNILGIIMGNTELALLDCKDDEIIKTLELIFEQTVRGKNLTKNLVAFAKDQEPKQMFFRISEKIDLVLNLMRKDMEGIELVKEERPGIPELLADPGMIEHALINLIQNSIHALSQVAYPRIIIRTYSRNNQICFEIEDNGCGIPKESLENIYEPSFTLKGSNDITGSYRPGIKGTGYGMSNVKKYIELHQGNISIESKFGSGTNFKICLPVIKKELTNEEIAEIRKEKAYFEKYILLIEDEMAISDVQYRILTQEPCNHKVDIANNGQIAIDLFDRNKYDLVSLDYILPGNINGMDVYHHIRAMDQTIPILFISGNIEFLESIKELKQEDSKIDHLSKPCQNKDYVNSINGLFERSFG